MNTKTKILRRISAFIAALCVITLSNPACGTASAQDNQAVSREEADTIANLMRIEARLSQIAAENPGDYGIGVLDIASGQYTGVNLEKAYPMASTMKIAVAAVYLDEVDQGRRSVNDLIGGLTAYDLMERMIIRSDNYATDMLIRSLGGPQVINSWIAAKGIRGMRVDRTIAQLLAAPRNLWELPDSSTPRAMLEFLSRLDRGDLVSSQSRTILLDMMRRCATGANRIKGMMSPDTIVEHKTGTLRAYASDVGYLTLPDGRRVAVVFFARGGENRPAVIATAARAIRDGFNPVQTNPGATWNPDYTAFASGAGMRKNMVATASGN